MDEEGDEDVAVNHIAKRSRYNKNTVVVFDNADRVDYLSGFRKRKDKRRQAAEQQKLYKERQKRIQDRRERRAALKETKGDAQDVEEGERTADGPEDGEDEIARKDVSGTATYEDRETTTLVRVTPITAEEEENATEEPSLRKSSHHGAKTERLKPVKVKFKKKKKVQSEKRMRKLTRREKSVPKNLRSRRDKKRKK